MITINRSDNPDTSLIRVWLRKLTREDSEMCLWAYQEILKSLKDNKSNKMEYEIYGTIKLDVSFDIEANSEEEAVAIATEQLKEYHRFEDNRIYHYDIKLGSGEIIYDDEE